MTRRRQDDCTRRRPGGFLRAVRAADPSTLTEAELLELLEVLRSRLARMPVRRPSL